MNDCPNCEYHRQRAQRWREEAYKLSGYPLPEREWWVGVTDEEWIKALELCDFDKVAAFEFFEAKLKEKNEQIKNT